MHRELVATLYISLQANWTSSILPGCHNNDSSPQADLRDVFLWLVEFLLKILGWGLAGDLDHGEFLVVAGQVARHLTHTVITVSFAKNHCKAKRKFRWVTGRMNFPWTGKEQNGLPLNGIQGPLGASRKRMMMIPCGWWWFFPHQGYSASEQGSSILCEHGLKPMQKPHFWDCLLSQFLRKKNSQTRAQVTL